MATWTIVTTKETAAKIPNNYFFFPVPFHYLTRTTFQHWNLSKFPYFHENLQEMHAIKRSWLRRRTYSAYFIHVVDQSKWFGSERNLLVYINIIILAIAFKA